MNARTKGILYVITAAFGFSMMSVFVRLAGDLPSFQKAFSEMPWRFWSLRLQC